MVNSLFIFWINFLKDCDSIFAEVSYKCCTLDNSLTAA